MSMKTVFAGGIFNIWRKGKLFTTCLVVDAADALFYRPSQLEKTTERMEPGPQTTYY